MILEVVKETEIVRPETGLYPAVVHRVYELGKQHNAKFNKTSNEIWIEFLVETPSGFSKIGKRYNAVLSESSNLYKDLKGIYGIVPQKLALTDLIGKYATLFLTKEGEYTNISNINPATKSFEYDNGLAGYITHEVLVSATETDLESTQTPYFLQTIAKKAV